MSSNLKNFFAFDLLSWLKIKPSYFNLFDRKKMTQQNKTEKLTTDPESP